MQMPWPFTKTRAARAEVEAQEKEADQLKRQLVELRQGLLDEALKEARGQGDDR